MGTVIRPEVSKKNKYWIDKHRHYELKHFCLQYPKWKRVYKDSPKMSLSVYEDIPSNAEPGDPTARQAIRRAQYLECINLIERTAKDADNELHNYILKAVTEGLSYAHLKSKFDMPCGKDLYYDRYRRFFWLLDGSRD